MNMTQVNNSTLKKNKYTEKLSRNATIVSSLFLLPASTQAVIIQNSSSLSVSNDNLRTKTPIITIEQGLVSESSFVNSVDWDIDGNSIAEFQLQARSTTFKFSLHSTFSYAPSPLHFDHSGSTASKSFINLNSNAQGILQKKGSFALRVGDKTIDTFNPSLPLNTKIGPNINESFTWSNFDRILNEEGLTQYFIGFSFLDDANQILYGWAEINSTLTALTIKQWAYQDDGSSIKIGEGGINLSAPVPLPPSALLMLSGLAMGAGGILRRRKLQKNN